MLRNGLRHTGLETGLVGKRAHLGRQAVSVERIARHRSDEIGAAPLQHRMQRRRVRHLTLEKLGFVIGGGNVETGRGNDPPGIHRVFVGMTQCDELVIADKFRKRKRRGPAQCLRSPGRAPASATSTTGANSARLGTR